MKVKDLVELNGYGWVSNINGYEFLVTEVEDIIKDVTEINKDTEKKLNGVYEKYLVLINSVFDREVETIDIPNNKNGIEINTKKWNNFFGKLPYKEYIVDSEEYHLGDMAFLRKGDECRIQFRDKYLDIDLKSYENLAYYNDNGLKYMNIAKVYITPTDKDNYVLRTIIDNVTTVKLYGNKISKLLGKMALDEDIVNLCKEKKEKEKKEKDKKVDDTKKSKDKKIKEDKKPEDNKAVVKDTGLDDLSELDDIV